MWGAGGEGVGAEVEEDTTHTFGDRHKKGKEGNNGSNK